MIKKGFSFFLTIILIGALLSPAGQAGAYTPSSFDVRAQNALLISADGNTVLFERGADKRVYPAAIVKVMTALLVIENASDLKNEKVPVTAAVLNSLKGGSYNAYNLKAEEEIPAIDLVYLIMLGSSNEAAAVAAEYYGGGSNSNFIKMMNDKAAALGMENTNYVNATGIHASNQYTTARDIYKLTRYAMENASFKEVAATRLYEMPATNSYQKTRYVLNNNQLRDSSTNYYYKYATGVKTGYTEEAGRCLVAAATKEKKSYICVLMNSPVTDADGKDVRYEFTDAKNLFEWAFEDFSHKQVLSSAQPAGEAKVRYSWDTDHVTLYPASDLSATIPASSDTSTVVTKVHLNAEEFEAPVAAGDVMGYVVVSYAGVELGRTELLAGEGVERSFLLAAGGEISKIAGTLWFRLIVLAVILLLLLRILLVRAARRKRKNARRVKDYRRM
ncbi:MAG: D-alanyl-D-alanine carboxypeptidase family protein [Candidatus Howiella sp.]